MANPNLKAKYNAEIAPALMQKFGYKSTMEIPRIHKIVVNVGCGEARDNAKVLESVVNDLATITTSAAAESDVIYVPTDNTVAANTGIVDGICRPAKVPVIAGEEGICAGCGVATLSISYYDIGYKTGEMAAQILTGEADIATMPIEYAPQFTKKYNAAICEELGLTAPEGYEAIG